MAAENVTKISEEVILKSDTQIKEQKICETFCEIFKQKPGFASKNSKEHGLVVLSLQQYIQMNQQVQYAQQVRAQQVQYAQQLRAQQLRAQQVRSQQVRAQHDEKKERNFGIVSTGEPYVCNKTGDEFVTLKWIDKHQQVHQLSHNFTKELLNIRNPITSRWKVMYDFKKGKSYYKTENCRHGKTCRKRNCSYLHSFDCVGGECVTLPDYYGIKNFLEKKFPPTKVDSSSDDDDE